MKINPLGLLGIGDDRGRPGVNPLGVWRPYPTGASVERPVREASERLAGASPSRGLGRAISGGRVSVDRDGDLFTNALSFYAPLASDQYAHHRFNAKLLERMPLSRLLEILVNLSPEVSRALWDFLLFCNPGWEAKAYRPGTEEVDEEAQKALDAFFENLHGPFSAPNVVPADVVIGMIFMQIFMRGAILTELVLNRAGNMPLEIATPDPATLRFRRKADDERGRVWEIGQQQNWKFVPLDRPTVCYVPLHPLPGSPFGRPVAGPAVFTSIFLIGLLHDLRRVISQQGYPRLDIAIELDKLMKMIPPEAQEDITLFEEAVGQITESVKRAYAMLEPDDAFVHTTAVSVNNPVGTVDAKSLGAIDGIIKALERMSVRALKTMPLMFGLSDSVGESHANRQWEVHAAGTKSVQHLAEFVLGRTGRLALQCQGIAAEVILRFAELRAAELLRDAQVERINIANAADKYAHGWTSQDEAALQGAGKPKADVPAPRSPVSTPAIGPIQGVQAEPGSERARTNGHRPAPSSIHSAEVSALQ